MNTLASEIKKGLDDDFAGTIASREMTFKQGLLSKYSPLLIITGKYKRRLYTREFDELVTLEDSIEPDISDWYFRTGKNGTTITKLDYYTMISSKYTNEKDSRISYE